MKPDFDVIIVGSGPAGVSAAFPLLEAGLRVLMVDGGKQQDVLPPEDDYLSARTKDIEQWKWMVGEDFHALKMREAVSPKLRIPCHSYAFDGFNAANQVIGKDFIAVGSLATGGLSNAWGCGVSRFSASEMLKFPFAESEIEDSYAKVCKRIGISGGGHDDLSGILGLEEYSQPPIAMDLLHERLFQQYSAHRNKLVSNGFRLGRSRVAALSEDISGRQACNLSGNCLWGCRRRSLYSSSDDLPALREHENFNELPGLVVQGLIRCNGSWVANGQFAISGECRAISASKIILAAGTLATSRIVLKALDYRDSIPFFSCPIAAFLLWMPQMLGSPKMSGFGFGQLSYSLGLQENITAFGSTFSTTGISLAEFARHMPLRRRYGIDLLRGLLSSCVVGNLFLPGHLTDAEVRLHSDDSLIVSGNYSDAVKPLMDESLKKLRKAYWRLGAILLPGSFTVGLPGGDIHYAGSLPMRKTPLLGETSPLGEVMGLEGVYVVDGACLPILPGKSHTLVIMANADRIGSSVAALSRQIHGN